MSRPLSVRARDALFRRVVRLPRAVLQRMAGGPHRVEGQELDAQLQLMLAAVRAMGLVEPQDVATSRHKMDHDVAAVAPAPVPMARERDLRVGGAEGDLRARLYVPTTAPARPGLLVFFHGGGFVCGSVVSHDAALRELAHQARCAVLSVEYRLGPEAMFPAAPLDTLAAYAWAREHAAELGVDPERVAVGGDSAGGNLSAVLCHLARERGVPQPTAQVLIYPAADWTRSHASYRTFGQGYYLEGERTHWYEDRYLNGPHERTDPRASPLFYEDFSGLAPAVVVTAGFDILRDEGAAYAAKLEAAGVHVEYKCERTLIHGFFNMSGAVDAASEANRWIAGAVGRYLAG